MSVLSTKPSQDIDAVYLNLPACEKRMDLVLGTHLFNKASPEIKRTFVEQHDYEVVDEDTSKLSGLKIISHLGKKIISVCTTSWWLADRVRLSSAWESWERIRQTSPVARAPKASPWAGGKRTAMQKGQVQILPTKSTRQNGFKTERHGSLQYTGWHTSKTVRVMMPTKAITVVTRELLQEGRTHRW